VECVDDGCAPTLVCRDYSGVSPTAESASNQRVATTTSVNAAMAVQIQ
jgi:hypothetical protein